MPFEVRNALSGQDEENVHQELTLEENPLNLVDNLGRLAQNKVEATGRLTEGLTEAPKLFKVALIHPFPKLCGFC